MDWGKYKYFRIQKQDKVGVLTIDHRATENRFDGNLHHELEAIWKDVAADDDINVAILTGTGDRFLGGIDTGFVAKAVLEHDRSQPGITIEGARRLLYNYLDVEKPVIAAVNGPAVSLGASVALFCDIIIASEKASFSDPHVLWGAVAGDGGPIIWPLLIGMAKAKQFVLTGDVVPAVEAERIGLINRVVPHDQLMPAAMEIAQRLANGATKAIRGTKICFNKRLRQDVNLIFDMALSLEWNTFQGKDYREAVRAYSKGETPRFIGR
ncbi:MAG: enoyl-CoA hydratase-related protein [Dehalococcoidia bacterium]|nr:enoyl-CoA hydratase-related protein [Dehalococcoidia bacterium]